MNRKEIQQKKIKRENKGHCWRVVSRLRKEEGKGFVIERIQCAQLSFVQ